MKKLIMFVMVFAIAAPALALKYPPHSPGFAGCANSGQVLWEFTEDGCNPTSSVADPPYYFDPDLPNPLFGTRYEDGGPVWPWSAGAYYVDEEDSLNNPIPERGGKQYLREYFEVVHTADPETASDDSLIGMGLEIWNMADVEWPGCPEGYQQYFPAGEEGYLGGYEFPEPTLTEDLGDGWFQSYWVFDFATEDGVFEDYFPDLFEATHATAIIGMIDYGAEDFYLEEVYCNYIWFNEADGSDIPEENCVLIADPQKAPLILETVDLPVYEPQDAGGPPPMGPTSGKLKVKLAWRPGDPTYPNFNCKVLIDPDPNQENVGNADFSITNPVPPDPNGNVELTFTQANYNVFQEVTIAATADLLREGQESTNMLLTVTIDINDPNFGSDPCQPVSKTKGIIVVDNDIPYISVLPADPCKPLRGTLSENNPGVPVVANVRLSHLPTSNVEVRAGIDSEYDLLFDMVVIDPNFEDWTDPNNLLFTPGNYNVAQTITFKAIDDDELVADGLEWVPGWIYFETVSDDPRYKSVDEDGELEPQNTLFDVQDNECGAWGYEALDANFDCVVDLADFAHYYNQWLACTLPYDDDEVCDKLWNLFPEEEE